VSRTTELLATVGAGAAGAMVAVLVIGASMLFVLPAALGVALVAVLMVNRSRRA
jgi:hypothetical protein